MNKSFVTAATALALAGCAMMGERSGPTAAATVRPASGTQVHGEIKFTQLSPNRVRVSGELVGHSSGPKGFHIHETGDCSAPDAMSAGGHFNPAKMPHGPTPKSGHAGDMGNVSFNDIGKATIDMVVEGISLDAANANNVIGRALVVHMQPDDLKTDPTGNAGARAACGVISGE